MAIRIILWLFLSIYNSRHVVNNPREQKNIKTARFGPSVDDKMTQIEIVAPQVEISVLPR